jgi:LacI family transcriptional regulator
VNTLLRQLRLEGVILLPPLSDHPLILSKLAEAAIPSVRIAPKREPNDSPSVGIDDRTAARRMTAHLLDLGHRAIGFIRGRPEHGATEQRYLGFTDEMRTRGVAVKSQWVQTGNFVFADGLECAERMLRGPGRPTAVFASNDDMAAAVICAARQRGLELPRQLSVVGFDDAPVATMVWPQLTTIRQPVREMARAATELIIRHSPRRRGWPQPIPRQQLNFELILRNSTAPPHP